MIIIKEKIVINLVGFLGLLRGWGWLWSVSVFYLFLCNIIELCVYTVFIKFFLGVVKEYSEK